MLIRITLSIFQIFLTIVLVRRNAHRQFLLFSFLMSYKSFLHKRNRRVLFLFLLIDPYNFQFLLCLMNIVFLHFTMKQFSKFREFSNVIISIFKYNISLFELKLNVNLLKYHVVFTLWLEPKTNRFRRQLINF